MLQFMKAKIKVGQVYLRTATPDTIDSEFDALMKGADGKFYCLHRESDDLVVFVHYDQVNEQVKTMLASEHKGRGVAYITMEKDYRALNDNGLRYKMSLPLKMLME